MKRNPLPAQVSRREVLAPRPDPDGAAPPTGLPYLLSGACGGTDLLPRLAALLPEADLRACVPKAAARRPAVTGRRSSGQRTR